MSKMMANTDCNRIDLRQSATRAAPSNVGESQAKE
jgi:hypothetical protein